MLSERLKTWLWPILIVVVAIGIFQYLKATKPEVIKAAIEERIWPVDVLTVKAQAWQPQQIIYGEVQAPATVRVVASLAAEVSVLTRQEGDEFARGDVLLELNPTEVQLTLRSALAERDEAKALLTAENQAQKIEQQRLEQETQILQLKKADLARNIELVQRNLASKSVVDQAKEALARQQLIWLNASLLVSQQQSKLLQLESRLAKAQVSYERAQLNAQRAKVIAPYDGRIAKLSVAQGDQVSANTVLLQYYPYDNLVLRANLPLTQRPLIEQALNNGEPLVGVFSQNQQSHDLPLLRLAGEASGSGLAAFFSIPLSLRHLRPGELLEVELMLPKLDAAIALPYSALYGSHRVYVVENSRLVGRHVKLVGEVMINGVRWALVQGDLHDGDQVNLTHLPNAINGLLVRNQVVTGERLNQ